MRYIFRMHINITQKWVRLCHHAVSQAVWHHRSRPNLYVTTTSSCRVLCPPTIPYLCPTYAPLCPTYTMIRPNLPIFPSHTPDLSVAGHMKYCLQFNTAPILIRPSMHARACRARNETCLGHWGRGKEVRRGLLLILQRLTTTSKNGNLSKTERRTGHSSFHFT